jgi:hypothetical protein
MKATHAHRLIADGEFDDGKNSKKRLLADAKNISHDEKTVLEKSTISTLKKGIIDADDAFRKFDTAYNSLIKLQAEVEKNVKHNVSSFKQRADEVSNALARVNKIAGDGFEERIKLLERFVFAVDQLDQLNESGRLNKVIDIFNAINQR